MLSRDKENNIIFNDKFNLSKLCSVKPMINPDYKGDPIGNDILKFFETLPDKVVAHIGGHFFAVDNIYTRSSKINEAKFKEFIYKNYADKNLTDFADYVEFEVGETKYPSVRFTIDDNTKARVTVVEDYIFVGICRINTSGDQFDNNYIKVTTDYMVFNKDSETFSADETLKITEMLSTDKDKLEFEMYSRESLYFGGGKINSYADIDLFSSNKVFSLTLNYSHDKENPYGKPPVMIIPEDSEDSDGGKYWEESKYFTGTKIGAPDRDFLWNYKVKDIEGEPFTVKDVYDDFIQFIQFMVPLN